MTISGLCREKKMQFKVDPSIENKDKITTEQEMKMKEKQRWDQSKIRTEKAV